mgnify:CR=1 FL=1
MTNSNAHNLLTDPVIRVEDRAGSQRALTLPGVLATLANGEDVMAFPGLRPHQWHAWHAFLVQIASMAMEGRTDEGQYSDAEWLPALRLLTGEYADDDPWCLAVSDLDQPAFMQPPVPEGSLKAFNGPHHAPDVSGLDVLVTTTQHDLKAGQQVYAHPDQWIFALIAYQTLNGYSSPGNYGVIRMNSGYGARVLVGLAWSPEWADLFRRDLAILRSAHAQKKRAKRLDPSPRKLLWLSPWDGTTTIPWAECDPYAVEIARRVRLSATGSDLSAYIRSTKVQRVSPKSDLLKGQVDDPWIPISEKGAAANVSATGWRYDRVQEMILGSGFHWPDCQQPQRNDPRSLWFYAVGLAGGQGKTEGFHERWIPVPPPAAGRLFAPEPRRLLGDIAKEWVSRAGEARNVFHRALVTLLASAGSNPNFNDYSDRRWLDRLTDEVDKVFFDTLWSVVDSPRQEQLAVWDRTLRKIIEDRLWPEAESEAPVADGRRERAQARAWFRLRGGLKKAIPHAYTQEDKPHADA